MGKLFACFLYVVGFCLTLIGCGLFAHGVYYPVPIGIGIAMMTCVGHFFGYSSKFDEKEYFINILQKANQCIFDEREELRQLHAQVNQTLLDTQCRADLIAQNVRDNNDAVVARMDFIDCVARRIGELVVELHALTGVNIDGRDRNEVEAEGS